MIFNNLIERNITFAVVYSEGFLGNEDWFVIVTNNNSSRVRGLGFHESESYDLLLECTISDDEVEFFKSKKRNKPLYLMPKKPAKPFVKT